MTPRQASQELRTIADNLSRSKNPDRRLVTSAIRRVLAAMGPVDQNHCEECGKTAPALPQSPKDSLYRDNDTGKYLCHSCFDKRGSRTSAMGRTAGGARGGKFIVIHRGTQGAHVTVTTTDEVVPLNGTYGNVPLPNGDNVSFYASLDVIMDNEDMHDPTLLEALFNAGLVDTDDDGNYILPRGFEP